MARFLRGRFHANLQDMQFFLAFLSAVEGATLHDRANSHTLAEDRSEPRKDARPGIRFHCRIDNRFNTRMVGRYVIRASLFHRGLAKLTKYAASSFFTA
ncbi:MAG: hypothetical protein ACOYM3_32265 [Terrimicrobiaceae bacterium]